MAQYRVWHTGAQRSIVISGLSEVFPEASLRAQESSGLISLLSFPAGERILGPLLWSRFARQDGSLFVSSSECVAYLTTEFDKAFDAGPRTFEVVVAAEALGSGRVVTGAGLHATPGSIDLALGISRTSAMVGAEVEVQYAGLMEDSAWAWTPAAPIFCGAAGVLTQTPPASGNIRRVAWAMEPQKIMVGLSPTLERE